jgi:hypothetical protein
MALEDRDLENHAEEENLGMEAEDPTDLDAGEPEGAQVEAQPPTDGAKSASYDDDFENSATLSHSAANDEEEAFVVSKEKEKDEEAEGGQKIAAAVTEPQVLDASAKAVAPSEQKKEDGSKVRAGGPLRKKK